MIRTIKRLIITILLPALLVACENKDLCYLHTHGKRVDIVINWEDGAQKPRNGLMRTAMFSLTDDPDYGVFDIKAEGDSIDPRPGSSFRSVCYDYYNSENIYFRNEKDVVNTEAYCASLVRASYTYANPGENTVAEPGPFYVDRINQVDILFSDTIQRIDFYPVNVLKTYTFRIRDIKGAQYITATRAALSGMSASYFLTTGQLGTTPSTVLFNARVDAANGWIVGEFRAFGRLEATNNFSIEILYPTATGGIFAQSWNVTDQMENIDLNNQEYDIEIITDITIIPEEPGSGGGFEATVKEWREERIPIIM